MSIKEKNQDGLYFCKKASTAIQRAIKEGILILDDDIDSSVLSTAINEAEETGRYCDFWKSGNGEEYFRFNLEFLDENIWYVDIGYRVH